MQSKKTMKKIPRKRPLPELESALKPLIRLAQNTELLLDARCRTRNLADRRDLDLEILGTCDQMVSTLENVVLVLKQQIDLTIKSKAKKSDETIQKLTHFYTLYNDRLQKMRNNLTEPAVINMATWIKCNQIQY